VVLPKQLAMMCYIFSSVCATVHARLQGLSTWLQHGLQVPLQTPAVQLSVPQPQLQASAAAPLPAQGPMAGISQLVPAQAGLENGSAATLNALMPGHTAHAMTPLEAPKAPAQLAHPAVPTVPWPAPPTAQPAHQPAVPLLTNVAPGMAQHGQQQEQQQRAQAVAPQQLDQRDVAMQNIDA
jgi:hypothetical protein